MQHTLKPYLINAFYSWCMDIGYTPLLSIQQWSKNSLPPHLKNDTTVIFNIHPNAVRNLVFGKDTIEFEGMFNGEPLHVTIYYQSIGCIYNREDEYGLDFEVLNENEEPKPVYKKPKLVLVKNDE